MGKSDLIYFHWSFKGEGAGTWSFLTDFLLVQPGRGKSGSQTENAGGSKVDGDRSDNLGGWRGKEDRSLGERRLPAGEPFREQEIKIVTPDVGNRIRNRSLLKRRREASEE